MISESDIVHRVLLGFVQIHVLHHAAEGPVYGKWLMAELERHGYRLGPGTLYPLLRQLAESGYLVREERVVGGRVRKYYRATAEGRAVLELARARIQELAGELLGEANAGHREA
ncbi:MAG: PadR family transcriptional regulator [Actinomycetia bacterium]|nr:PadR family transcriptional regulator [Actinomycetes bacterium]